MRTEHAFWLAARAGGVKHISGICRTRCVRRILDRIGQRIDIKDPAREVDALYDEARSRGEPCIFLPFCPPNTMPTGFASTQYTRSSTTHRVTSSPN